MRKKVVGWLISVLALGGVYAWATVAARPQGSDEVQVRAVILTAAAAMSEGRASNAMSVVSPDYKDSTGMNYDRLNILARRAATNHKYWTATVRHLAESVRGDQASVELTLAVNSEEGSNARNVQLGIVLRRESVSVWGVIPTQRWRVMSVSGIPEDLAM
jgi:hypothetical protein